MIQESQFLKGYRTEEEFVQAAKEHHDDGGTFLLMRPMACNVDDIKGGVLVDCDSCGRECWKTENEPDPLPVGVKAVCTDCALRGKIPE